MCVGLAWGTESWSQGLPETIYKLSGFSFYFAKVCEYWNFLRLQIRNDSIYTRVSTVRDLSRTFGPSILFIITLKKSRHVCKISQARKERVGKKEALPSLSPLPRLTLDVSFNWVRTKHEMSRQKDSRSFDVKLADSLQCLGMQSLRAATDTLTQ